MHTRTITSSPRTGSGTGSRDDEDTSGSSRSSELEDDDSCQGANQSSPLQETALDIENVERGVCSGVEVTVETQETDLNLKGSCTTAIEDESQTITKNFGSGESKSPMDTTGTTSRTGSYADQLHRQQLEMLGDSKNHKNTNQQDQLNDSSSQIPTQQPQPSQEHPPCPQPPEQSDPSDSSDHQSYSSSATAIRQLLMEAIQEQIQPIPYYSSQSHIDTPGAYGSEQSFYAGRSVFHRRIPPSSDSVGLMSRADDATISTIHTNFTTAGNSTVVVTAANEAQLVEARAVTENQLMGDSSPSLGFAQPVDPQGNKNTRRRARNNRQESIVMLLWIAVGAVVLAGLVLLVLWWSGFFEQHGDENKGNANDDKSVPTEDLGFNMSGVADNYLLSPEEYLVRLLPNDTLARIFAEMGQKHDVSIRGENTTETPTAATTTPQLLAFQWLIDDPALKRYSRMQLQQRFALACFYYATSENGAQPWTQETHWMSYSHHECEWHLNPRRDVLQGEFGEESACDNYTVSPAATENDTVALNAENHYYPYVRLWLRSNNLQGKIPEELYWLTHLKSLDLSINRGLAGTLSANFAKLSELRELSFRVNPFTGVVPSELGALTQLSVLYLSKTELEGTIPKKIFTQLTHLQQLQLSNGPFIGTLATELGLLTNLKALSMAMTRISGTLPSEIGSLQLLQYTYLFQNLLTGTLPAVVLGTMSNLAWLHLHDNQLSGKLPSELGLLTNLQELKLNNNMLTGTIPPNIGNMTRLYELYLGNNQITGSLPLSLFNLTSLKELSAEGNLITGSIPGEVANMENLEVFVLSDNQFNGSIPWHMGQSMKAIIEFRWDQNLLFGTIPLELGLWNGTLSVWDVSNNLLTGILPPELSSWWTPGVDQSPLSFFNISGNDGIFGTIPKGLCGTLDNTSLGFDCNDNMCGCDCSCSINDTGSNSTSWV
ncbi:receptor-like protein kinase precursor [Seminavis robusta]|uniref:non-specific serine/threonine protein kinase n=1 Tax=Seminavis robusta TaxID=568900 RepID=A0A9N8GZT2_9STRA|nr:receptor-like protein kinase precursor [Seminavis robusta]|eukprot:Sro8_g006840.1 receptor-like protein kinase precursor (944) ;mRNA; f:206480-209311